LKAARTPAAGRSSCPASAHICPFVMTSSELAAASASSSRLNTSRTCGVASKKKSEIDQLEEGIEPNATCNKKRGLGTQGPEACIIINIVFLPSSFGFVPLTALQPAARWSPPPRSCLRRRSPWPRRPPRYRRRRWPADPLLGACLLLHAVSERSRAAPPRPFVKPPHRNHAPRNTTKTATAACKQPG